MVSNAKKFQRQVTADLLQGLPVPVQRYLAFTGVLGQPWIDTARVKQAGRFRRGLDQPWMPVDAIQTFTTDPPGFVWNARFKLAGIPLMRARDMYQAGHGHMFGKLAGLFTLFDARGPEMDQGTLMRYLGEMIWFPTAFLGTNITWQAVDSHNAQVTLADGGQTVTASLTFDTEGRPVKFSAMRYIEENGRYTLAPWSVPMTEYKKLGGLTLPVRGLVTWNLPDGDLPYYDWQITRIEYNRI